MTTPVPLRLISLEPRCQPVLVDFFALPNAIATNLGTFLVAGTTDAANQVLVNQTPIPAEGRDGAGAFVQLVPLAPGQNNLEVIIQSPTGQPMTTGTKSVLFEPSLSTANRELLYVDAVPDLVTDSPIDGTVVIDTQRNTILGFLAGQHVRGISPDGREIYLHDRTVLSTATHQPLRQLPFQEELPLSGFVVSPLGDTLYSRTEVVDVASNALLPPLPLDITLPNGFAAAPASGGPAITADGSAIFTTQNNSIVRVNIDARTLTDTGITGTDFISDLELSQGEAFLIVSRYRFARGIPTVYETSQFQQVNSFQIADFAGEIGLLGNSSFLIGAAGNPLGRGGGISLFDLNRPGDPAFLASDLADNLVVTPRNQVFATSGERLGVDRLVVGPGGQLIVADTFVLGINRFETGSGRPQNDQIHRLIVKPSPLRRIDQNEIDRYAVGGDLGNPRVFLYQSGDTLIATLTPFANSPGGVRVAVADVTGDGTADLIAATGPGVPTQVVVIDGVTFQQIASLAPFEATFTGGVFLAAGDIDNDGVADIVITPDEGGGPRARLFSAALTRQLADFFVINDPNFRGGARTAVADLNNDGRADLIGAAGFLGGPRVAVFNGEAIARGIPTTEAAEAAKFLGDFFVFEQTLRNGVFPAGGDINGDGFADVLVGGGPGGGPRVFGLSGRALLQGNQEQVANFFAGDSENRSGVRLVAKDLDGDANADLVTGPGNTATPLVSLYRGSTTPVDGIPTVIAQFNPFEGGLTPGIFVG